MSKLPNPSNKYDLFSVAQYYSYLELIKRFDLLPTEKDNILKILRGIDTSKSCRLPGRFLKKYGANVLAKPITGICNLSISLNIFPSAFKLAKVSPIFKKGRKTNSQIFSLPILSKVIEKLFPNKQLNF